MALQHKSIGNRIAELRKARRFTQQVMAEKLKVSYRGYQGWEAGQMPSWPNLEKIADFHNVSPEWIIGEEESPAPSPFDRPDGIEERLDEINERLDKLAASVEKLAAAVALQALPQQPAGREAKRRPREG